MSEKELLWVGSSLDDLKAMPLEVIQEFGYVLGRVQNSQPHAAIKAWAGESGVYEIRVSAEHATYRTVYVVTLPDAIYVLHAFQKKSVSGIKTAQRDRERITERLRAARLQSKVRVEAQNEASKKEGSH